MMEPPNQTKMEEGFLTKDDRVSDDHIEGIMGEPSSALSLRRPMGLSYSSDLPGDVIVIVRSIFYPLDCMLPYFGFSNYCKFDASGEGPRPSGLSHLTDDTWTDLSCHLGKIGSKMWPNNLFLLETTMVTVSLASLYPFYWLATREGDETPSYVWRFWGVVVSFAVTYCLVYHLSTSYLAVRKGEVLTKLEEVRAKVEIEGYYIVLVDAAVGTLGTYEIRFRPITSPPPSSAAVSLREKDTSLAFILNTAAWLLYIAFFQAYLYALACM